MSAPRITVAHLRRVLTPGTKVRIVNHRRPAASRDTVVHPKTNTVDLVTWAPISTIAMWARAEGGDAIPSHLSWPKPARLRGDEDPNTFHIDEEGRGSDRTPGGALVPFLTVTVMPEGTPDWPTTCRPLSTT